MPLLYKPRDPMHGVRRDRRKPNKRKRLDAFVMPDTKAYIELVREEMPTGRLVDEAIQLYRKRNEQHG